MYLEMSQQKCCQLLVVCLLLQTTTAFVPKISCALSPSCNSQSTRSKNSIHALDRCSAQRCRDTLVWSRKNRGNEDASTSSSSSTVFASDSSPAETTKAAFEPPSFDKLLSSSDNEGEKNRWIARLILIAVAAFYGTNFGCVKVLNDSLEPSVSAFCRFTLASLVFMPYVLKTFKVNRALVMGGLEVGAYNALGYFFQSLSLETTSASTVAFICSLAVVVVPLIDLVFPHGERKADQEWYTPLLPALLAAAGVGSLELGGTDVPGVGDLLALGQPIFFGYAFYRIETMMRNCKEPGDAQAFTGSMMISVALGSLAWTLHDFILPHLGLTHTDTAQLWSSVQEQMVGFHDWKVVAAVVWTGVVTTALTAYGENYAMKSLSAAESTVIYSTEPLWGTAFAAVALGEHVGLNTFVGAALILSACVWSSVGPTVSIAGMASTVQLAVMQNLDELGEQFGANWAELMEKLSLFQGAAESIPPEL